MPASILRAMRTLTAELPGTGGLLKTQPEDFVVDELPAYAPSGEGTHTFMLVEKRGLTTAEAVQRLGRALGFRREDAGAAGQKDRQAVTRQWISAPAVDPERALAVALEDVRVVEARRHGNKLRTGHLVGNRFRITVRGTSDGVSRARAILERLDTLGLPNYFGPQRFGARGDNAARGKALIVPSAAGDTLRRPRLPGAERRLLVSAYQSELFNRYLDARIDEGLINRALNGDVLKKSDTGGLFTVDEAAMADAETRLTARAVVVTGPMFGHKMMAPPVGTPSRAREDAILAAEGLDATAFAAMGRLAEGTRRPLLVPVAQAEVATGEEPASLVLTFTLPPGAYATVLLAEVMKP
jgi:tRNA pseudouridine13 synthase